MLPYRCDSFDLKSLIFMSSLPVKGILLKTVSSRESMKALAVYIILDFPDFYDIPSIPDAFEVLILGSFGLIPAGSWFLYL